MLITANEQSLCEADRAIVLDVVRRNVALGLQAKPPFQAFGEHYSVALRAPRASIVSLQRNGRIVRRAATLVPHAPLISDVCHNAYEVASHLATLDDQSQLTAEVHLVGPLTCLVTRSANDVLRQLKPGLHGVLLQHADGDATFTPDKWQLWPDASEFLRQLQIQAGLDPQDWSADTHVSIYTAERLPPISVSVPPSIPCNPR